MDELFLRSQEPVESIL